MQNEIDNARECLRSGDVEGALSAYERASQKQDGDMQYEDIRLAICVCKYYLGCQTGKMSEIEKTGEVLRNVIFLCRKAGLVCRDNDDYRLQEFARERGVDPKGMSLKDLVFLGNEHSRIGAIDAESLCFLGDLVCKGAKAPLGVADTLLYNKDAKRIRGMNAEDMIQHIFVCLAVYLEEMGLDRDLKLRLYNQIVDLKAWSGSSLFNTNFTLYGNNENNLSINDKMNEAYQLTGRVNPQLKIMLITMGSVMLIILIIFLIF
ncbi:MAG: hypothetical protein K6G50_08580 [bacterium]|nr:hypothetical protein [bacterium]